MGSKFSWLFFASFACLLLWPRILWASIDKNQLSSVLTAFKASDPSKEQNLFCRGGCHLAKASHRVTSIDIEISGARTLLEVLGNFPGIFVTKDHFGRPAIGLYGLRGQNRVQILIDGIRQNDPYDGFTILNLPAFVIDYIDVYYGPGGTWFGEGSLLGVISVFTKQLPELKQFGQFSHDLSLGGGMMAAFKQNRIRTGAHAAFFVQNPESFTYSDTNLLRSEPTFYPLHDLSASGFFEYKISNAAQAYLLARTALTQEMFSSGINYGFGKFEHNKIFWQSDLHLLKKRAQKNALDLFFSCGLFRSTNRLHNDDNPVTITTRQLEDSSKSLRFELGTKFHVKPFYGHDLFFGLGGIIEGMQEADHHVLLATDEAIKTRKSAMAFSRSAGLFGRPSAFFVATTGHVYGFIQDEWQIRAPLLFTVGSRLMLPVESQQFSAELLPNIAAVLIPINKLRFTIAFQTSMRTPTFFEQSDRMQDALLYQTNHGYVPPALDFEKSRTIESSAWYGEILGDTQFKTSFAVHLSKIDDAISTSLKRHHNNQNEIHIAGLRSINEVIFNGGHSFALGVFYSLAFRKEFDEQGYSTCQAGFLKGFSKRRYCPFETGVPRLMLKSNLSFDMASAGGFNLACAFYGQSTMEDIFTEPQINFEITYFSKPLWRYVSVFASVRSAFFGYHYRVIASDMIAKTRSFSPTILALVGWSIKL